MSSEKSELVPFEPLYTERVYMSRGGYALSIVCLMEMFDTIVWTETVPKGIVVYRHRESHPAKPFRSRYYNLVKVCDL